MTQNLHRDWKPTGQPRRDVRDARDHTHFAMVRVIARLVGPPSPAVSFGDKHLEVDCWGTGVKKFKFDAVYGPAVSDAAFFAEACAPLLAAGGAFLCSGSTGGTLRAFAEAADARRCELVDVRREEASDALTGKDVPFDGRAKTFGARSTAPARDARDKCDPIDDAHRVLLLERPALCVAALSHADDTRTQQGLAALLNVLTSTETDAPYQDSKLTRLLQGRLSDPCFCVFVPSDPEAAGAVALLKYASRLGRGKTKGNDVDPMFESLRSRAVREAHEAEVSRLEKEKRETLEAGDAALARALRDGELAGAKATAAERERCDREVAAKLRADDADADRARTQRMLEADRKLAADLAAGDYDAK